MSSIDLLKPFYRYILKSPGLRKMDVVQRPKHPRAKSFGVFPRFEKVEIYAGDKVLDFLSTAQVEMSCSRGRSAPLLQCADQFFHCLPIQRSVRTFSSTAETRDTAAVESSDSSPKYDPETVTNRDWERELVASGIYPIGSRRRRAALKTLPNIPFEKLPYQCFQEARAILKADRQEKMQQIENERARIARLVNIDGAALAGGEAGKQRRLRDMRACLEKLKILADINDPLIKKRFEDGQGMSGVDIVVA